MRIAIVLVSTLVAAGALAAGALAKEAHVELSSTPAGIGPGDPWTPVATVLLPGDRPVIGKSPTLRITKTDAETKTFVSEPTGELGHYQFHVVFPSAGTWRYEVRDRVSGRTYVFPAVVITAPSRAPSPSTPAPKPTAAPAGGSDSFPLWPVLGGSLAALAAIAAAWRLARPGRLGPSAPGA